jgi:hypothetical protein
MRCKPLLVRLPIAVILFAAAASMATAGPVVVNATVTPLGPLFHYDYSITNNTGDDLLIVDITVPKDPSLVSGLTAPSGFQAAFDSGLGLVSFLEDSSFFTASPIEGLAFDSPNSPAASSFDATVFNAALGLYTVPGPTVSPVVVPEPGYAPVLAVLALAFSMFLLSGRKAPGAGDNPRGI